jgi:hypothetical protein
MRSGSGLSARARDHNLTNDSEFIKALLTIGKSSSAPPPSVVVRSQHRPIGHFASRASSGNKTIKTIRVAVGASPSSPIVSASLGSRSNE